MCSSDLKAWHAALRWPLPQQSMQSWHLAGMTLAPLPSKSTARDVARTVEARPGLACRTAGSGPTQQPCPAAGQGITYFTSPLKAAMEVTGHPEVSLWVDIDGEDAHVFAYLQDVAPDGTVSPVTEGRLRATLRAEHQIGRAHV